jgi:hypothetical protein
VTLNVGWIRPERFVNGRYIRYKPIWIIPENNIFRVSMSLTAKIIFYKEQILS